MQNEVWEQVGNFLNSLQCENVGRKSYIQFSELKWERTIIFQSQKMQECHSVRKRKKMLSRLP